MAKQQSGSHQPLGWPDRLRLNAAKKHLRSRFHNVRMAALKEIQAILQKRRGFRRRLADRVVKPAVRKVTPRRLHEALGVSGRAPKAPKRTAPGPATPWRGYTPPSGRPLTNADLKERARAMKRGERLQPQGRAPQAPQAPEGLKSARDMQEGWQRTWDDSVKDGRQKAQARAQGNGHPPRQPDLLRQAGLTAPPRAQAQDPRQFRTPLDVVARPEGNGRSPGREREDFLRDPQERNQARDTKRAAEGPPLQHSRALRELRQPPAPPLPSERVAARTQDKPRWARLKRDASSPRSRSRTA